MSLNTASEGIGERVTALQAETIDMYEHMLGRTLSNTFTGTKLLNPISPRLGRSTALALHQ